MVACALAGTGALALSSTAHGAFCADVPAAPCIESATLNGSPVTSSSSEWELPVIASTSSGSKDVSVNVQSKTGDPYELGPDALDDVWVINVDTGSTIPRVVFNRGSDTSIVRTIDGDGTYHVQITATPVGVTGGCDQTFYPWTCSETAVSDRTAYLDANITDYGSWSNPFQRRSFYGMDFSTNVDATTIPPQIISTPAGDGLLIEMANSHFLSDGTTLFTGFADLRIPNAFLKAVYGIDDPASLTGAGIATSTSGSASGTGTTTVTLAPGAVLVDISGMTFSNRRVRVVRGDVRPTRPRAPRARRTGDATARIRFRRSKPRGSKIKRYVARCRGGGERVRGFINPRPRRFKRVIVKGLNPDTRYVCRARAISKAAPGRWSKRVAVPPQAG